MRIISQNGMIDVPYEMVGIYGYDGKIRMNMVYGTGKGTVLAEYSTKDKARKAMEMLRAAYENYDCFKTIGLSEGLKIIARNVTKKEFRKMISPCFQFPADHELEGHGWQINLPCKVGDTIYVIDTSEAQAYIEIEPFVIESISIFENGKVVFYSDTYNECAICDLDSLVNGGLYLGVYRAFLTKEEAEEALKKIKEEG